MGGTQLVLSLSLSLQSPLNPIPRDAVTLFPAPLGLLGCKWVGFCPSSLPHEIQIS